MNHCPAHTPDHKVNLPLTWHWNQDVWQIYADIGMVKTSVRSMPENDELVLCLSISNIPNVSNMEWGLWEMSQWTQWTVKWLWKRETIYSLLWKMLGLHTFTNGMGKSDSNRTCTVINIRVIQMEKVQSKTREQPLILMKTWNFINGRERGKK